MPLFKKQSQPEIEPKDVAFEVAAEMFQKVEKTYLGLLSRECNMLSFRELTKIITLAEETLHIMKEYQLGNRGIVTSQTSIYLVSLLQARAKCFFNMGNKDIDPENNYQLARIDCNAALEIAAKWDLPASEAHVLLRKLG
ncbi:MAG: hypothetical protein H6654_16645 [Ardenticatenaceae bacterium]|nr:hypothetical protein [Anaerolineales bacterium]MCB8939725.1 hypothetical protein [Ardenticatenaceae bacterium]MCB8975190.1 hypothetical protein [Ardenticatenaceae bacterium]